MTKQATQPAYVSAESVRNFIRTAETEEEIQAYMNGIYKKLLFNHHHAPDFGSIEEILDPAPFERPHDSPVVGVIVESRKFPLLPEVVLEFAEQLQIPIQIFHGPSSAAWIMNSVLEEKIRAGKITLTSLKTDYLPPNLYNTLLLTRRFWDALIGRKKVLIFQCDAALCKESDYDLSNFICFDYIGSRWPQNRPVGVNVEGGNGGFSLRDWSKSVECLTTFPPDKWKGAEDTYFAFHMTIMGAKVANHKECEKFGTQHFFNEKSFGAHKISCLPESQRIKFLQYCEKSKRMLND